MSFKHGSCKVEIKNVAPPVAMVADVPSDRRMTEAELLHIERNLNAGYRWGCEMKMLIEELKYYLTRDKV